MYINMKRIVFLTLLFASTIANAQKEVTKFLGIPVDGFKSEMINKLKAKGFQYDKQYDWFTGEFNGHDVRLAIATNNNKVWRIMIQDAHYTDEANIKIRFNKLCRQFENNKKYVSSTLMPDQSISDDEDISYEMMVHKKRYDAAFYQVPTSLDSLEIAEVRNRLLEKYTEEELAKPEEEQSREVKIDTVQYVLDKYSKRNVWFMIDEKYGEYRIIMYYDNEFNHSDGEDL